MSKRRRRREEDRAPRSDDEDVNPKQRALAWVLVLLMVLSVGASLTYAFVGG